MKTTINEVEEILGYTFKDKSLLIRALTHRSVSNVPSYERLEFLGDSVLSLLVTTLLFKRFPESNEGTLTRAKASIVSKRPLASLCRQLGIHRYLILGACETKARGLRQDSICEDVMEALIGAVFLDTGCCYETTGNIVYPLFKPLTDNVKCDIKALKDNKTRLQEVAQGRRLALPQYTIKDIQGKQHEQLFTVSCAVGDYVVLGKGKSRRIAEQVAAGEMLKLL